MFKKVWLQIFIDLFQKNVSLGVIHLIKRSQNAPKTNLTDHLISTLTWAIFTTAAMIVYEQKNAQINKKSADVPKHKIIKRIKAVVITCSILFSVS